MFFLIDIKVGSLSNEDEVRVMLVIIKRWAG